MKPELGSAWPSVDFVGAMMFFRILFLFSLAPRKSIQITEKK